MANEIQTAADLREQRTRLFETEVKPLSALAGKEQRTFTTEEQTKWDKLQQDLKDLESRAKVLEITERQTAEMMKDHIVSRTAQRAEEMDDKKLLENQKLEARAAVTAYFNKGKADITAEQRTVLFAPGTGILIPSHERLTVEQRAQSSVTANLGAEMVRDEVINEFEKFQVMHSGVLEACRTIRTSTGGPLSWPSVNDTVNKGRRISEGASTIVKDIPTDTTPVPVFDWTSDAILVPQQLEQDDGYGFMGEIPDLAATRVAAIYNEEMTIQAVGGPDALTESVGDSGVTVAANTISRQKLLELIKSVPRNYRKGPKVGFMMNDATAIAIMALSFGSGDDRPLYTVSPQAGGLDRIEGYPIFINDDLPDLSTSGNAAIIFGDFNKQLCRLVRDFVLKRANELHLANNMIGFYGFARQGGKLINNVALKKLTVA